MLLGAAGVLEGKRATSHWAVCEHLRSFGAEPVAERVVVEGKVITAAGVSAGIDMAAPATSSRAASRSPSAGSAQTCAAGRFAVLPRTSPHSRFSSEQRSGPASERVR